MELVRIIDQIVETCFDSEKLVKYFNAKESYLVLWNRLLRAMVIYGFTKVLKVKGQ